MESSWASWPPASWFRPADAGWPGLTGTEIALIERDYELEFADDHRAFLAAGLPLNAPSAPGQTGRKPWPDWRDGDADDLHKQLDWPIEGTLFDVEHNALWHRTWGPRPADTSTALYLARQHLTQALKMVPIYGHRYLPAGRGSHGHPACRSTRPTSSSTAPTWPTTFTTTSATPAGTSAQTGPRRRWSRSGATFSDQTACHNFDGNSPVRSPAQ